MGYNIGMDFGTTNSTVSYINDARKHEAFRYPGPQGYEYIPSCVAYDTDRGIYIGRAALDYAGDPEVTFCSNLKMILPLSESDREKHPWTRAVSPEKAIADYIRHILSLEDQESASFKTQKGNIDGIVLSVPHVWTKGIIGKGYHPGRSMLQDIIQQDLNLPLIQLISEPVAAAAYFAYQHQQTEGTAFEGTLLICDMGGGTFDITLCRVEPGKVEELHNDGNGRVKLGKAGVRFDRGLIMKKLEETREDIKEDSSEFYEIYNKLQDHKAHNHSDITKKIANALEEPDFRKKPILRAGKYSFSFEDIQTAFQETETGIKEVLGRFKTAIDEKGYPIDRVFFVGGFSEFYLVRTCIKQTLNLNSDDRFIQDANKEISRFAISYGAALLANEMIQVEEKYEHTIGIEGYTLVRIQESGDVFEQKPLRIPIIKGGKKLSEYQAVHFDESRIKVHNDRPDVVIYVDPESKGRIVPEKVPEDLNIRVPNAAVPGNYWHVGMRINRSKVVYLVFKDREGATTEYELGDIVRKMFGGLEIITE